MPHKKNWRPVVEVVDTAMHHGRIVLVIFVENISNFYVFLEFSGETRQPGLLASKWYAQLRLYYDGN